MNTSTTTFWKLLSDVGIEIPIIQRDYAQGRSGKEELRKSFLRDLKDALDRNEPMRLDFVYGTMESGKLIPLDGQQRLTTLWLLHWYLAYRAGKLSCPCTAACLKKFTYETRISSRLFCENLAGFSVLPPADTDIAAHIRDQRWFRRIWRSDPTIQAMLRMLSGTLADKSDGIEGVFNCSSEACKGYWEGYWEKLTSPDCPIVFYNLPLPSIAHSDDLYIKMNARGKPLTSFENFKADLAGYIEQRKGISNGWNDLLNARSGLPIMMDTKWMRLFWENKSPDYTIDEIYFAFINRFFFGDVCLAKMNGDEWLVPYNAENSNDSYRYLNDSRQGSEYDLKIAYNSFQPYKFFNGEIPLETLQHIKKVLDLLRGSQSGDKKLNDLIPLCEWNKEFRFLPEYVTDKTPKEGFLKDNSGNEIRRVTFLTQPQRVVFYAICKFFWESSETINETRFKRWLRVVWNLVSIQDEKGNPVIRTFSAMRAAMDFIKDLDSQNVYDCLAKKKSNGDSAFELQCYEEIEKARKILDGGAEWEKKIACAENYAFFHGAIRFLFHDETGNVKWDDFDVKWVNAQSYFDTNGVTEAFRRNSLLLRALLVKLGGITEGFWFGNGADFWRNQVLLNAAFNSVVSELLLSEVTHDNAIPEGAPAWIADNTLLSDAIANDNDPNGQWHIIANWFGDKDKTLTRYSRREKGNVKYPWQIIPLCNLSRNELFDGLESEQRRGKCYFIGWTSDVNFLFNDRWFKWRRAVGKGRDYIYLLKNDWKNQSNPYEQHQEDPSKQGDEQTCYCFKLETDETKDNFMKKLNAVIENAGKQSPVLS
ncbi:MAG: DUF262 domain-containing protein [Kiritimatiellae bacterium]|nr:DUF262 domain-containing protein [Kiritimatiellia bacterium]